MRGSAPKLSGVVLFALHKHKLLDTRNLKIIPGNECPHAPNSIVCAEAVSNWERRSPHPPNSSVVLLPPCHRGVTRKWDFASLLGPWCPGRCQPTSRSANGLVSSRKKTAGANVAPGSTSASPHGSSRRPGPRVLQASGVSSLTRFRAILELRRQAQDGERGG